jgi:hypothetical protein
LGLPTLLLPFLTSFADWHFRQWWTAAIISFFCKCTNHSLIYTTEFRSCAEVAALARNAYGVANSFGDNGRVLP